MKMKPNSTARRKRRKLVDVFLASVFRPSCLIERLVFVVALTLANQICDTNSTPAVVQTQQASLSSSSSSSSNELTVSDEKPATSKQAGVLVEPQDSAALVGQQLDLICIIDRAAVRAYNLPVWTRNGIAFTSAKHVFPPFDRRYSLPEIAGAANPERAPPTSTLTDLAGSNLTADSAGDNLQDKSILNFTLRVLRVMPYDDQANFGCSLGNGSASRPARLSVWQPPGWVSVLAKTEELDSSSASGEPELLMASVVPDRQSSENEDDQITRILVRHNTRLRLECRAEASKPAPKLTWFDHQQRPVQETFSGAPERLQEQPNSTNGTQSQLQLIEPAALVWSFVVQRHHNDHILTCQADHPAFRDQQQQQRQHQGGPRRLLGAPPRQRVRLEVQFEPEINLTREPAAQAHEHQPIRFRCEARGRPNVLTYRWYIDHRPVLNASEPELQISALSRQMSQRDIRCQVSNEIGSASSMLKLNVNYAPAFVTHLLPASLQPASMLAPEPSAFHPTSSQRNHHSNNNREQRPMGRHELATARQLAVGVEPGQDLELRCDFDAHPRVQEVRWFKLPTDYSILGNVTPAESQALIERGALYASFKDLKGAEIDYEQMSAEELAAADEAPSTNSSSQVPVLELLESQPPTLTSGKIYEPLDWTLERRAPISLAAVQTLGNAAGEHEPQAAAAAASAAGQQQIATLNLMTQSRASSSPASSADDIQVAHSNRGGEQLNWRQADLTSSKLLIRQASVDSVGKYVCRARSAGGGGGGEQPGAARAIYVVLREKPRIVSHPLQVAGADDGLEHSSRRGGQFTAMVECLAQINTVADNSTQIQWFRDGQLIEETTNDNDDSDREETSQASSRNGRGRKGTQTGRSISIIVERSPDLLFIRSRLKILAPTSSDFGVYNCTVINSYGVPDSMAISLLAPPATGSALRAILGMGIVSALMLASAIACILALTPQRSKLGGPRAAVDGIGCAIGGLCGGGGGQSGAAKVISSALKDKALGAGGAGAGRDQSDSAATTNTAPSSCCTQASGSDTDSLRKPSSEVANGEAGAHYLQLSDHHQHYAGQHHHQHQHGQHNHHYQLQQQQHQVLTGQSGHYQMPSSVAPPPPPLGGARALLVESPYASRAYFVGGPSANHYATTTLASTETSNGSQQAVVVATDGEAQFESQYGSMISNAYRALGYSSTSSPSSGGSMAAPASINVLPLTVPPPPPLMPLPMPMQMTIGVQQYQHHSSGSASSSPSSIAAYHHNSCNSLQATGYVSNSSGEHRQHFSPLQNGNNQRTTKLPLKQRRQSPPSADIQLLMKSSAAAATAANKGDIGGAIKLDSYSSCNYSEQSLHGSDSANYIAAASATTDNNNGLATHV